MGGCQADVKFDVTSKTFCLLLTYVRVPFKMLLLPLLYVWLYVLVTELLVFVVVCVCEDVCVEVIHKKSL